MRQEDVGMRQSQKILGRFSLEITHHSARDVLDLERALVKIWVVDFPQGIRVMSRHFLEHELDIAKIGLEFAQHFIDQGSVFDDQQVCVKNPGVLRPNRLGDALLHFENLRTGLNQRRLETGNLVGDL